MKPRNIIGKAAGVFKKKVDIANSDSEKLVAASETGIRSGEFLESLQSTITPAAAGSTKDATTSLDLSARTGFGFGLIIGAPISKAKHDMTMVNDLDALAASTKVVISHQSQIEIIAFMQQKIANPIYNKVYSHLLGADIVEKIRDNKLTPAEIAQITAFYSHRLLHNRPLQYSGPQDSIILRPGADSAWMLAALKSELMSIESAAVTPELQQKKDELQDLIMLAEAFLGPHANRAEADRVMGMQNARNKAMHEARVAAGDTNSTYAPLTGSGVLALFNPLVLANRYENILEAYISTDELQLGRRLAVSGLSHLYTYNSDLTANSFSNDGKKKPADLQQSTAEPAFIHSSVGLRFEKSYMPEYKNLIMSSTEHNNLMRSSNPNDQARARQYILIDPAIDSDNPSRNAAGKIISEAALVNKDKYKAAMKEVYLSYLANANAAAKQQGKLAYVNLNFYGLSSWIHKIDGFESGPDGVVNPIKNSRTQILSGLQSDVIRDILANEANQFTNIGVLRINSRNAVMMKNLEDASMPAHMKKETFNDYSQMLSPSLASGFDSSKHLYTINNSWDAASYHGNELYAGAISGSLDPILAYFANTSSTFNPLINPVFSRWEMSNNIVVMDTSHSAVELVPLREHAIKVPAPSLGALPKQARGTEQVAKAAAASLEKHNEQYSNVAGSRGGLAFNAVGGSKPEDQVTRNRGVRVGPQDAPNMSKNAETLLNASLSDPAQRSRGVRVGNENTTNQTKSTASTGGLFSGASNAAAIAMKRAEAASKSAEESAKKAAESNPSNVNKLRNSGPGGRG